MELILTGISASLGKAEGKARIIGSENDIKDFKDGEIIISQQTTPLFVVILGKAKAVVTDMGGITAHAAIVSRELGIPCVVGTEKATRFLRNGDKILVDGNEGKVYRL